jgi:hypothetical protein
MINKAGNLVRANGGNRTRAVQVKGLDLALALLFPWHVAFPLLFLKATFFLLSLKVESSYSNLIFYLRGNVLMEFMINGDEHESRIFFLVLVSIWSKPNVQKGPGLAGPKRLTRTRWALGRSACWFKANSRIFPRLMRVQQHQGG